MWREELRDCITHWQSGSDRNTFSQFKHVRYLDFLFSHNADNIKKAKTINDDEV